MGRWKRRRQMIDCLEATKKNVRQKKWDKSERLYISHSEGEESEYRQRRPPIVVDRIIHRSNHKSSTIIKDVE
jgi:5-methylcytosine-specific restriction endonuclease McrA